MALHFLHKPYVTLPQAMLERPGLLIGKSGVGKTETALRLVKAAAFYGDDVIYLDAKGDYATAARFVAVMQAAGKQRIKAFPFSSYDGWRGDADALFNRMMAVQSFSESYYEGNASLMLSLALNSPDGVPRNSEELLENLSLDRLRVLYRGCKEEEEINRITAPDANGVYTRYRAFFKALRGKLDHGFTFDDTDAAYILLDGIAFRKETSSIGRYLVEDIAHYIARRKPAGKKVLIIIDEVSALAIDNIANLVERLRSFGGSLWLSCQSEQGLAQTPQEQARILGTAHTLILHTCNDPERLVARAGKRMQVQKGWSVLNQEETRYGTMHLQEAFVVPPDSVRRLDVGEAYIIVNGHAEKMGVAPVTISPTQQEAANAFLLAEERAARKQAPPPTLETTSDERPEEPPSLAESI